MAQNLIKAIYQYRETHLGDVQTIESLLGSLLFAITQDPDKSYIQLVKNMNLSACVDGSLTDLSHALEGVYNDISLGNIIASNKNHLIADLIIEIIKEKELGSALFQRGDGKGNEKHNIRAIQDYIKLGYTLALTSAEDRYTEHLQKRYGDDIKLMVPLITALLDQRLETPDLQGNFLDSIVTQVLNTLPSASVTTVSEIVNYTDGIADHLKHMKIDIPQQDDSGKALNDYLTKADGEYNYSTRSPSTYVMRKIAQTFLKPLLYKAVTKKLCINKDVYTTIEEKAIAELHDIKDKVDVIEAAREESSWKDYNDVDNQLGVISQEWFGKESAARQCRYYKKKNEDNEAKLNKIVDSLDTETSLTEWRKDVESDLTEIMQYTKSLKEKLQDAKVYLEEIKVIQKELNDKFKAKGSSEYVRDQLPQPDNEELDKALSEDVDQMKFNTLIRPC